MAKHRKRVIERFPEEAERISELSETNPAFDALCHEFSDVSGKLDALHDGTGDIEPGEHDRLHRRRAALEQELVHFMSSNVRS